MSGFDPDKFLQETAPGPKPFDPDAFLAATAPKGPPPGTPAQTKPLGQGDWRFKAGPAFTGSMPMIHGAKPGEGQLENEAPSAKVESPYDAEGKASPVSAGSAIAGGLSQGASADFGDELQGVVHAIAPGGPVEDRSKETPETPPTWKEALVAKYAKGRDAGRRENAAGADQHPGYYGTSHLIGNVGLAAANPVGGAAGGALVGGGMALGGNDADLTTEAGQKDALYSTAGGMLAGGALGATAENIPKITGVGLGLAGLGLGAFGDRAGMTDAQRVEAAEAGGLGLGAAALSGALKPVANKAAAGEAKARGALSEQIEGRQAKAFEGMDREQAASKKAGLKQFEGISKIIDESAPEGVTAHLQPNKGDPVEQVDPLKFIDKQTKSLLADEKPYQTAAEQVGKDKIKAFQDAVAEKQSAREAEQAARAAEDKATSQAFRRSEVKQAADDNNLVQAFRQSENPAVAGGAGHSPEDAAAFEASIPQRVKGKLDADYGAVVNRYNQLKQFGQEIPPELESKVQAIKSRYADNSPDFFDRFLDFESKAPQYEADLRAQARAMRGAAAPGRPEGQGTVVEGTPRALRADTGLSEPPPAEPAGSNGLDEDRAAVAKKLGIPYKTPYRGTAFETAHPELAEAWDKHTDAYNRALNQMLGVEEAPPGFQGKAADLLSPAERNTLDKQFGVKPRPTRDWGEQRIRNEGDLAAWDNYQDKPPGSSPTVASPGRSLPSPAPADAAKPSSDSAAFDFGAFGARGEPAGQPFARRPESFYSGPRPEADFVDSPINNADWEKVSGAHVKEADLSHDQLAEQYWKKQPFTDSTAGISDEAPKQPPGGFKTQVQERAQQAIDAAPDKGKAWVAGQAFKAAAGKVLPSALVSKLMAEPGDPAVTAKILGRVSDMANVIPNFQAKYGRLLNQASGLQDFINRLRFVEASEDRSSRAPPLVASGGAQ